MEFKLFQYVLGDVVTFDLWKAGGTEVLIWLERSDVRLNLGSCITSRLYNAGIAYAERRIDEMDDVQVPTET